MLVKFEDVELAVQEDGTHEWLLDTELVAQGYGVSESSIREHKRKRSSELLETKHWVVRVTDTPGGKQEKTYWTKKGVIRLGFFIKSDRARKFRDWAEDLIVKQMEPQLSPAEILLKNVQLLIEQEKQIDALQKESHVHSQRLDHIEAKMDSPMQYCTIMGWAVISKKQVKVHKAAELGRKAKKLCDERGHPIDKVRDPRFGQVGSYPIEILKEVFKAEFGE